MGRAVRRRNQTPQQRMATILGGVILVALIVVLLATVIQGSRRPATDSAMQRVLTARVVQHNFIMDGSSKPGDTVFVSGHYAGVPKDAPQSATEWEALANEVAKVYAKDLTGLAKSVEVKFHYRGELVATVTQPVK